ncbi:MAG TPA: response regulator [Methanocella sp.]|uniref:response regulator n=1 Tax=Methanocella sp. TaxID=2052833 RepID=UPI002C14D854|nr:response regulator [Methanocella sp.]HTY90321.1 response regulator [Methanocella sp.]
MINDVSVAIVDDERDLVRTYELLFKRRGIRLAFVAYDGHSAIERFNNTVDKPGVVIIDYRLPDMDGLDLMKEVLALRSGTKIVFISGDDTVRQDAMDAGATVFLKKPADIKMITETINALINS